jgi:hypothetical protein
MPVPQGTALPRYPLDLVVHIGSGKTGTSSIQHFLNRNRARLAELGYLYPRTPGATRHVRLGLAFQPEDALGGFVNWHRQGASSPNAFRRSFRRRLFREIDKSGLTRVLFSDEALYGSPNPALRRLRDFVDQIARRLKVVVYLRRQDDHLVSRYQQVVKVGETRRLVGWAREMQLSESYDYSLRLRTWQRLLDPDELVVRRFEHGSLVDGSLFQDFLESVGIEARAGALDQGGETRNVSLDAESVEFLRLLNLHRVENEGATVGLIDNRNWVRRLAEHSTGPIPTLPTVFLDAFMDRWADGNREVARRYLRDKSGELFRMPRKTENTTTEQCLDPARINHFVALLELPEHVLVPLRRIAEREANNY